MVPPSQAKADAIRCIMAGIVPFIQSSPGLGKSSIAREIAKEGNLELIDFRLSQCAPEDLQGIPFKEEINGTMKARFLPFTTFPLKGDPIPKGKNGWLLFLDEFNSASKSVQAAGYKLILDRMVGDFHLHEKVAVIAAGNLSTDRAIVNPMSTAMQSRLAHILMTVSKPEFIEWCNKNDIDYRVIGFIEFQPDKLHYFQPDHHDLTFACPRTWEFTSKLVKGVTEIKPLIPLLSGVISPGIAMEFAAFCEEYTKIPKIESIINDPEYARVPVEISTRFAVITMLMANSDENNIKPLVKYMLRFSPEEQIIFFRGIINRNPKLRDIPEVEQAIIKVISFVDED